jgi:hypothetical protein
MRARECVVQQILKKGGKGAQVFERGGKRRRGSFVACRYFVHF